MDIATFEKALEEHFAIFKPGVKEEVGFRFTGPTRLALVYDESGQYIEYDVANGNTVVEEGVLSRPEKVRRSRTAA